MYHKSHEYLMPVSPMAGATRRHGLVCVLCFWVVEKAGKKLKKKNVERCQSRVMRSNESIESWSTVTMVCKDRVSHGFYYTSLSSFRPFSRVVRLTFDPFERNRFSTVDHDIKFLLHLTAMSLHLG
jgi:hypothetical protein